MSRWAQAKQVLELDWRQEWRTIAERLQGAQPADLVGLVLVMDQAYHQRDKAGFLVLKDQLVKHPSWTGSSDSFNSCPVASCEKPTVAPIQQGLAI